MTDRDSLLNAIRSQPLENTPRLAFADFLDEQDNPADANRAEFIRNQIELEALGRPHAEVYVHLSPNGPDCWTLVMGDCDLKIGERVNVHPNPDKSKGKTHYALRVVKIEVDDPALDTHIVTVRQDEYSKKYPAERVIELSTRINELLEGNWRFWLDGCPIPTSTRAVVQQPDGRRIFPPYLVANTTNIAVYYEVEDGPQPPIDQSLLHIETEYALWGFRRGFISYIRAPWIHVRDHLSGIVKSCPVSEVELIQNPTIQSRLDRNGPRWIFQLEPFTYDHYGSAKIVYRNRQMWDRSRVPMEDLMREVLTDLLKKHWPSVPKFKVSDTFYNQVNDPEYNPNEEEGP